MAAAPRAQYIGDLLLTRRWYGCMGTCSILFVLSFFFPWMYIPTVIITLALVGITIFDYTLLFFGRGRIIGERVMPQRFSMGDENGVKILLQNTYPFRTSILMIDELPIQFQDRTFRRKVTISY